MADENGAQDRAGDGEGAGDSRGRGDGTPSREAPTGNAGDTTSNAGAAPSTAARSSVPLDALPEALRGQPDDVIRFTLNKMVESLSTTNARNRELEAQLKNGKGIPGQATSSNAPESTKEEVKPAKPLDEWLLEDPDAALDHFIKTKYGGVFDQVNQVSDRVSRAELSSIRAEVDDFAEYEEEVNNILDSSGTPKTRENILGAYVMAVGNKTIETKRRASRAANNPERGANDQPTPEKDYRKTELSEEIRTGLGITEEDYYEKFSDPSKLEIKVPR